MAEAGRGGSSGRRVSEQGRATDSSIQADPHIGDRARTQAGSQLPVVASTRQEEYAITPFRPGNVALAGAAPSAATTQLSTPPTNSLSVKDFHPPCPRPRWRRRTYSPAAPIQPLKPV